MSRLALSLALLFAACAPPDPCSTVVGTCLTVDISGSVGALDSVSLSVSGAATGTMPFTLPAGVRALPVAVGVELPAAGGVVTLECAALNAGRTVGLGSGSFTLPAGSHARAKLVLTSVAGATCSDGFRDGDEADVDCGGACPACADGKLCKLPAGCTSGVCAMGTCAMPVCTDAVHNGGETDVDCGGGTCPVCANGKMCKMSTDCASGVCDPQKSTCSSPTCSDNLANGDETDVDCGGATCHPCANGEMCKVAGDCLSVVCSATTMRCLPSVCTDMVLNGGETDVDCGGIMCPACANGKICKVISDCQSLVCDPTALTCAAPTCMDGEKNEGETDVDCGGTCPGCAAGKKCKTSSDCASLLCNNAKLCTMATCSDGVRNQGESDIDCGGGTCVGCATGKMCKVPTDCQSGVCGPGKTCAAPSCSDGVKNGNETDVDCGGSCGPCAPGKRCSVANDCAGKSCTGGLCALTFGAAHRTLVTAPQQIVAADFNHDGKLDLATVDATDATLIVLLGDGTGSFTASPGIAVGKSPAFLAAADVAGSGHIDLVVSDHDAGTLRVFLGDGVGGFSMSTPFTTAAGPLGVTSVELNGDGRPDLAVATDSGSLTIVRSTGGAGSTSYVVSSIALGSPLWSVAAGDLDGNMLADLVVSLSAGGALALLNDGMGGLGAPVMTTTPGRAIALGDLNGDGQADLLVASSTASGGVSAFLAQGTMGLFAAPRVLTTSAGPAQLALGDFDRDKALDIASPGAQAQSVSVLRGHGDGSFDAAVTVPTTAGPSCALVGDFNGDGKPDLAVSDATAGDVAIYLNTLP